MALRIVPVGEQTLEQWRLVHNEIIPTAPLSVDQVAERATSYRLTLAYDDGDALVGNATVRPPDREGTATVIVRVLPAFRRRGHGSEYLRAALADARALGARRIRSVVLASNLDGLDFARRRGFVELERYVVEGSDVPFVDLVLTSGAAGDRG